MTRTWLRDRAAHRGRHGDRHVDRQRLISLLMVSTGIARALVWLGLMAASLAGLGVVVHLFQHVFWVAILSLYANFATDLSTVAGSWASLVAGDAHHDAEVGRAALRVDLAQLDADLEALAAAQPGPEARRLADGIHRRLHGGDG